jgi:uroporphyrinogen-III decarboxylase
VAIVGKVVGLWTLGCQLFGVERFLMMTVDEPDMAARCSDRLKEIAITFGLAQIAAGADALTVAEGAIGDLCSAEYYRRFLLILHICGDTIDRMDDVATSGAAMFHFDSKSDPVRAKAIVGDRIGLVGNIDNVQAMYARGPEVVRYEIRACLDAGINMIAPGCAIPLATRLENLLEIPRAVEEWSSERA